MTFVQAGISLADAPLKVLERVAITSDELGSHVAALADTLGVRGGATILSTCNRTELYANVEDPGLGIESMMAFLQALAGRRSDEPMLDVSRYARTRSGLDSVRHLFAVAAGLDSLVVGDAQVSSQVRGALHAVGDQSGRNVDRGLSRLLHAALRTGRKARRTIADRPVAETTVPTAAVRLLDERGGGSLRGSTALVVGSGETARLAAQEFQRRGVRRLMVTSRRQENAVRMASAIGCEAVKFGDLATSMAGADYVLACTASPVPIVGVDAVAAAQAIATSAGDSAASYGGKAGAPVPRLHVMDLGVPRDVDARVADLEGVTLSTVEDLRDAYRRTASEFAPELTSLVDESAARFHREWEAHAAMRDAGLGAEQIRRAEMGRTLGAMSHLSPADRAAIDAMTRAIVKGVLAGPMRRLKGDDHDDG